MKHAFHTTVYACLFCIISHAQVTQINADKSLHAATALNSIKTILVSDIDSTVWITEGTAASTLQLSASVQLEDVGGVINGKLLFRGRTAATGSELYITDGTPGGTGLLKDIFAGSSSSAPADFVILGNNIYFTAVTAAEGRELWRSDGTAVNTSLVKDIVPGSTGSNAADQYEMYSNGSYLLFAATTAAEGTELWKSDGSAAGTILLKDIYTGTNSSKPHLFYALNNLVLFVANTAADGGEIWKTDGTAVGTGMITNINAGAASSTEVVFFPGFSLPLTTAFHTFNNKAFFVATDGGGYGELWSTDGTAANTSMVYDIFPGTSPSSIVLYNAINLPDKFVFAAGDGAGRSELWACDGSAAGTEIIHAFSPAQPGIPPILCTPFSNSAAVNLFSNNRFFVVGGSAATGDEMWISDGTAAGTQLLKDIHPGTGSGVDLTTNFSYLYSNSDFFFAATDGVHGNELWRTNGTETGTTMVQDINPNAAGSTPELNIINNGKILFGATDGDDPSLTDFFVVDGSFTPLPVTLSHFSVTKNNDDAILRWQTVQEQDCRNFTIQRSFDAVHFDDIGTLEAVLTAGTVHQYRFTDPGIALLNKYTIYYRLRINDNDGHHSLSNILALKYSSNEWQLLLLGNPVSEQIHLAVKGVGDEKVTVVIKDISGRQVYMETCSVTGGRLMVAASNLGRGAYTITLIKNGTSKTVRFIK